MKSKLLQTLKTLRTAFNPPVSNREKKFKVPTKVSGLKSRETQNDSKLIKEPGNILTSVWDVYFCIKILNFIPITFPTDFTRQPYFRTIGDAIQVVILILLLIFQIWIYFFINIFESRSILLDFGNTTMIVFGTVLVPFNVAYTIWTRDKIWSILKQLDFIDGEFQNLGITVDYHRHRRIIFRLSVLQYGLFLFALLFNEIPLDEHDSLNPFLLYIKFNAFGCIVLVHTVFIYLLISVYTRFKYLNKCIQNYFHLNLNEGIVSVLPHRPQEAIHNFSVIYEKLNDIIDLINFTYGVKVMFCFGLIFVYTVFTSFATYWVFIKFDWRDLHSIVCNCLWNLIFGAQVVIILIYGSSIFSEGCNLTCYVFWAMNTTSNELIIERLFDFTQQIRHRSPVISCGLFPFDYTVIYTMAASLATYLVILIQFERSSNALSFNTTVTN